MKKSQKTKPISFTVLMIIIGVVVAGGIIALIVCRFVWGTGANRDRRFDDAIIIAKTEYGCDDVLAVSHASVACENSRWCVYVLAIKGEEEVFLVMPSSPDMKCFESQWQLNLSFREIAKRAMGDSYAEATPESLRAETVIIDKYDTMPRFYNMECQELDELIRCRALDVPFMIQFENGKSYAVQVGGEIKIYYPQRNF